MSSIEGSRLQSINALWGVCVLSFYPFGYFSMAYREIWGAAFFLVSGYVIPFSLQETGGIRSFMCFWIERFFKLWPT
jgi:peptidoglycan/LPS O-acetylase OafA/YrhL